MPSADAPDAVMHGKEGPLEGIKVLDLSTMILGPLATQYLGFMGADVIKIESPAGDLTRQIGPRRSPNMGAFFLNANYNKRSIVLDLKNPASSPVMERLIAESDVVLHSIRSNAAKRLGLLYGDLAAINPQILLCHVTGFLEKGLYSDRPAYDDVGQALSGLASMLTSVAGEPRYIPNIMADKVTAVHAAYAVAIGLFHRERTGMGQEIQVPMMETMVSFNLVEHMWGKLFEPPLGEMGYEPIRQSSRRPCRTTDGYICIMPYTDQHWREFFALADAQMLLENPMFATFAGRQANIVKVWEEVQAQVAKKSTATWFSLLEKSDIPYAPVNSMDDLLEEPHLKSVDFWHMAEHPSEGTIRVCDHPIRMSESPAHLHKLPPRLGEHTVEILREFGFRQREIGRLLDTGAAVAETEALSG
jgi:crotonobetainyl-CoA:carnitine CoA-transferase CaiB-like acyl-CoA transferase